MTRRIFEAAHDCTSKIKGLTPAEEQIKEMLSLLSKVDRLFEICEWEGPSGLRGEAENLPDNTVYEKVFKESIYMWIGGSGINEASDYAADRYFEENPTGYNAAIFFATVYSVANLLAGESAYSIIDMALQFFLPDGWRWAEEDEKESELHKYDKDWMPLLHSHRKSFLGDPQEERLHRFDDVNLCNLLTQRDDSADMIGRKIADRLPCYKDGALQLILKELTYPDLEKSLYVLPEEAGDRIIANLSSCCVPIIKGQCILNKNSVCLTEVQEAIVKFEEAMNAYTGNPDLEAAYED